MQTILQYRKIIKNFSEPLGIVFFLDKASFCVLNGMLYYIFP